MVKKKPQWRYFKETLFNTSMTIGIPVTIFSLIGALIYSAEKESRLAEAAYYKNPIRVVGTVISDDLRPSVRPGTKGTDRYSFSLETNDERIIRFKGAFSKLNDLAYHFDKTINPGDMVTVELGYYYRKGIEGKNELAIGPSGAEYFLVQKNGKGTPKILKVYSCFGSSLRERALRQTKD